MTKIVLVTGGFDPIHSGHIEYFKSAKKLGDKLIVGVNSDAWLTRKKGHPFMPWKEEQTHVYHLEMVDDVIMFDDTDGSACGAIASIKAEYEDDVVIFANGGDRTKTNIPEIDRYGDDDMVEFVAGGEDKMNSSSWILNDFYKKKNKTDYKMMDFLKDIVKEIGDEYTSVASDIDESETFVDTGSYIFNGLVSGSIFGGVSGNKITAIAGESSTGKTFFISLSLKIFLILILMGTAYTLTQRQQLTSPC